MNSNIKSSLNMKKILFLIFLISPVSFSLVMLLSNTVFGVTPKYYSVGQCVSLLTISKDITGTDKLNELMEECEKIMKPLDILNGNTEWIPINVQKEMLKKLWILKVYLQVQKKTYMFVDVTMTWPKKENEIIKFLTLTSLTISISNLLYGKTPQFYTVGECLMRTINNKIQL